MAGINEDTLHKAIELWIENLATEMAGLFMGGSQVL
jgi:hypothetical protein